MSLEKSQNEDQQTAWEDSDRNNRQDAKAPLISSDKHNKPEVDSSVLPPVHITKVSSSKTSLGTHSCCADKEFKVPLLTATEDDKPAIDTHSLVDTTREHDLKDPDTDLRFITQPTPLAALRMNLSFAGCGFLGVYHLGVAKALSQHGSKLLLNTQKFAGASAGALVAAALAVRGTDPEAIQRSTDFTYKLALDVRKKKLGSLTPGVSLLHPVEDFLKELMPDDAYKLATDRLYISLTKRQGKKNVVVSKYESNEHLMQCLMASSYIPFVTGSKTVYVAAEKFIDGGMTNNLPVLESGRTIRVSPFSGRQEICPMDRGRQWFTCINQQDFQVNKKNLVRGLHGLFPPKREHLERYHQRGYNDAIQFLRKEGFFTAAQDNQGGVNLQNGGTSLETPV